MLRIGQVESSSTDDGKYTDGNVAGGIAATRLRAAAFNAIQEELAHIVESTGVVLDIDDTTQVLSALNKIFAGNSDALGALAALTGAANKFPYFTGPKAAALADLTAFAREILAQTDAAGVLTKLGLGEAAKQGVATSSEMQTGTATDLLPTVAAVMSLFSKRSFVKNDFIRIPDVPGGLIVQWMLTPALSAGTGISTVQFPTPYPTEAFIVLPIRFASTVPTQQEANPTITALTKTNFSINIAAATSVPAFIFSIGQ